MNSKSLTPLEKIDAGLKLIQEGKKELEAAAKRPSTPSTQDDSGGSNPPGPGQPGKP